MNWRRIKPASHSSPDSNLKTWAVPVILEVDDEEIRLDLYVNAKTKKASRKRAMYLFERLVNGGFAIRDDGL
tara:strand:+ start:427 stop:642 length:216 start_codon:yes stop_codon:yes gene_type:complete